MIKFKFNVAAKKMIWVVMGIKLMWPINLQKWFYNYLILHPQIKLADFGFARHFTTEGSKLVDMTSLAGTPVFMVSVCCYYVLDHVIITGSWGTEVYLQ